MGITSTVLRFAAPLPKIMDFSRYLLIGPHPDDIEIGAGATVAALTAAGKHVSFLICTDGRYGLESAPPGTTPDSLIKIRKAEALAGAETLGVSDVHFLNLSDGGDYSKEDLLDGMAKVIGEVQPDAVFAPDPFVAAECHADHLAVGKAARMLSYFAPYPEIMALHGAESAGIQMLAYYMTGHPNRFVCSGPYLERQFSALHCHVSQFPDGSEAQKSLFVYLKLRALDFGIRSLKGRAEGFRVLGKTQMHCLPEAK